ncbi:MULTISPECIES: copper ion binding protein [Halobacillus]|uniref:Copper chaperone CopZ n=2 Tax=Halobacillus TaxID=45667 RepID=I0JQ71_HALH3|nr:MULTISPECIES: copper ion binding protein [Halobacillus]ASF40307.1 copper-binding protein [Halobacillus halophilus]MCA1011120.1 copper ion binding protein [Halobacillus halophilus]CCG46291.1 copper chaperone CopZ [Halobacillus halophilus DSM 2266]SFF90757.1 copper chaperone [Halobacillus alkaliphilus]
MDLTLEVNGMSCEHCEKTVKESLEKLEGVHGVEVHLSSGKVDVMYDEAYVSKGMMKEAIEAQGYEAVG